MLDVSTCLPFPRETPVQKLEKYCSSMRRHECSRITSTPSVSHLPYFFFLFFPLPPCPSTRVSFFVPLCPAASFVSFPNGEFRSIFEKSTDVSERFQRRSSFAAVPCPLKGCLSCSQENITTKILRESRGTSREISVGRLLSMNRWNFSYPVLLCIYE